MFGHLSGKLLGVAHRSKRCSLCEKGHAKSDHQCRINWDKSAKAMEPSMAVELVVKNKLLAEENVRVKNVISDDDASSTSDIRRNASWKIEKWSDLNHSQKSVTSKLWDLKLDRRIIDYFGKCFILAIKQNKDVPEAVSERLKTVVPHAYGEHDKCPESFSCHLKGPEYEHKNLPNGANLSDVTIRPKLEAIFEKHAKNANQLAPCGSTQKNESFNHILTKRHPKNKSYSATLAFPIRLLMSAVEQNEGSQYILDLYKEMNHPATFFTQKHRTLKDSKAAKRKRVCADPEFKKHRNAKKRKRMSKESNLESREGVSYQSNCGLLNVASVLDNSDELSNGYLFNSILYQRIRTKIIVFRSTCSSRHVKR